MQFDYPISLNLKNKKCTVVGGGVVAQRKVKSLLSSYAKVTVITSKLTTELQALYDQKKINWIKEENFHNMQLFLLESFLVIAATNNRNINSLISAFCKDNKILVNIVDCKEESSFIVNSKIQRGDLLIAISTNGQSPALARKVKEDLEVVYGMEYEKYLQILGEARNLAKNKIKNIRKRNDFFRNLIQINILDLIKDGNEQEAKKRVKQCLLSYLE